MGIVATVMLVLSFAAAGAAQVGTTPGWIDERTLGETLEVAGVAFAGRRHAIDSALCTGLRRFGHREIGYRDQFHRFKCSASGADGHYYMVSVTITRSVVSSRPIAGRGEPAYLARDLRGAKEALAGAEASVATAPGQTLTAAQKAAVARFLRPYQEAVSEAKALLEPYRTRFWFRVTTVNYQ